MAGAAVFRLDSWNRHRRKVLRSTLVPERIDGPSFMWTTWLSCISWPWRRPLPALCSSGSADRRSGWPMSLPLPAEGPGRAAKRRNGRWNKREASSVPPPMLWFWTSRHRARRRKPCWAGARPGQMCWKISSRAPTSRQTEVVGDNLDVTGPYSSQEASRAGQLDHAVALSAPAGQHPDPLFRVSHGTACGGGFALRGTDARYGRRHRGSQDRAEQSVRQCARYRGGPDL